MPDDVSEPREYLDMLGADDMLRVRWRHRRGVPVEIMVQLECFIRGEWRPVRRYDTHLALHVHTAPWDDALDQRVPIRDVGLRDALTRAIDDIKANRACYRAACEASLEGTADDGP